MSPVCSAGLGSLVISSLRYSAPSATAIMPAGSFHTSPDTLPSTPYIVVVPVNAVPLKLVASTCCTTLSGVGPNGLITPVLNSGTICDSTGKPPLSSWVVSDSP